MAHVHGHDLFHSLNLSTGKNTASDKMLTKQFLNICIYVYIYI